MLHYYMVYAKADCGWCTRTVTILNNAGIDYALTLVDKAPDFHEDLKNKHEHVTVPLIVRVCKATGENEFIGGHDDLIFHLKEQGLC